ncbi:MAG: GDP-mannose 4,6-dehydratase, partial [Chitinophagaceae bacterium]
GSLNILESVYQYSRHTKVFISGSALQFVNTGSPIAESDLFEASSSYAVSRIHTVYMARYYRQLGLQVYVGYFFHHDSPRRPLRHLNMKIAQAALNVRDGSEEWIEVGDIDVVKEYNYAGDMMEAIWKLVNQSNHFEAVIGSGKGYSIKDWIEICFSGIGKDWTKHVRTNPDFKPDFSSLISDPFTIFSIGWRPEVEIKELAAKMMSVRI